MNLNPIKNIFIGTLALPSLLLFANPAAAIEAIYICPAPIELQITFNSGYEDNTMNYSSVMTGKVTGFDPNNAKTDVMWDTVPMTGQTNVKMNTPKLIQPQDSIRIEGATLASNKVFCEYQLHGGQNIKLSNTRNLLVSPSKCEKTKTAEGLVGFKCNSNK
jgi:hypothetical protein